jgi:hypothetical protein
MLILRTEVSHSKNAQPTQCRNEPFAVETGFDTVRPKPLGLTVGQALKKFGPEAKKRLLAEFQNAGLVYPPEALSLVCLKSEQLLLLFAKGQDSQFKQIASHPLVSYSGELGPKLKEGDLQIPEGCYKITSMDAITHLCLRVNYPNQQDKANARGDHRTSLGGEIQIHEGVYSTGCVVISHDDMADLFVLAHDIGIGNIDLIIAPCNLMLREPPLDMSKQPKWLAKLYTDLRKKLAAFPMVPTVSH